MITAGFDGKRNTMGRPALHPGRTALFCIVCLLCLSPAGRASSGAGPDFYQETVLEFGAQTAPTKAIRLAAAKNEHLPVNFTLRGMSVFPITAKIVPKAGAPEIPVQFWQLRPVPRNLPQEFFPDGLVPLASDLVIQADPFRLTAVVSVPSSIAPGAYDYEIVVESGTQSVRQPLTIRIWSFGLENDLPITILAAFRPNEELFRPYGVSSPESCESVLKAYLQSLRAYKVNAVAGFYPLPVEQVVQGRPLTAFPQFLQMLDFVVNDLGYRFFRLPRLLDKREPDQFASFRQRAGAYYPPMVSYLQARGWLDKAIIKEWDEPRAHQGRQVLQLYRDIKAIAPGVRTESAGGWPAPEMAGAIDIWAYSASTFDPNILSQLKDKGMEVWLYYNRLHGIDRPPAQQRAVAWYVYRYGFSGYLLWGVNAWGENPWTTVPGRSNFYRRGAFFYPDPRTGMPLPTYRLEAMRRGWEDYQYLTLLTEAAGRGLVNAAAYGRIRDRVAKVTGVVSNTNPDVTWQQLEDLRLEMGELLNLAAGGRGD